MQSTRTTREESLLRSLADALDSAGGTVREIEVGTELSIALGRERPHRSCGGCSEGLEFRGIPARTVASLREPYRLILAPPSGGQ